MPAKKSAGSDLGTVGVIGRFKPLHLGGAVMLEAICQQAEHVIIGIGSCNKYNLRNPFTAEESAGMVDAFLAPRYTNYEIVMVPDFAQIEEYNDGQRWRRYVVEHFPVDTFVSGNDWVKTLLEEDYTIVQPAEVIPPQNYVKLRATEVRIRMAQGNESWKNLVPDEVVTYLEKRDLVSRFRKKFGLQTLAYASQNDNYGRIETLEEEREHTQED